MKGCFVARIEEPAKSGQRFEFSDARHRHERLGLLREEAAFFDALAGGIEEVEADLELVRIAQDLMEGIRRDLTVNRADWKSTGRRSRTKIKRPLRKQRCTPSKRRAGGGSFDNAGQLILDQQRPCIDTGPT